MAESFLGVKVLVLLHSGIKLEGVVSHIEPSNQQMTLKDVTLFIFGQPPHRTPIYGVVGKDIKDLQVISSSSSSSSSSALSAVPAPAAAAASSSSAASMQPLPLDHHVLEQDPPPKVTPVKSVSKTRKMKQPTRINNNNNNNNNRRTMDGWAGEDVNIFIEEEFDFQKNLDMFDKAKVFAEIREADDTAPEELLVTLNRLPPKKNQINLLPTENVLDMEPTAYNHHHQHPSHPPDYHQEDDFGDESDTESQTPDEYARRRRKSSKQTTMITQRPTKIFTVSKVLCPPVSPLQMAHVEHECTKASTSFDALAIENSGRGTALLILQLLNQMDVVSPSIIILVGNNKNGAIGLVTARHLMNHGCLVTACITAHEQNLSDPIIKYEIMARRCGVITLYHTDDLGESDLIVDAILGIDDKLIDIQEEYTFDSVCNSIDWANNQPKPTLSIDFPSGVDASTGVPHHPDHMIYPKWTICLGAPKSGCKSEQVTGDLYLVDIGIPRLCWERVGMKGSTIPWGADFLVALEYKTT
ncbi:YjeF N-terminal domain-containing protein [Pilaira anomala]|nr:YjeF N-terminal domain-containing protein [Pilaira anomala]